MLLISQSARVLANHKVRHHSAQASRTRSFVSGQGAPDVILALVSLVEIGATYAKTLKELK